MTFKPFNLSISCESTQRGIALPLIDRGMDPEVNDTERKFIINILERLHCETDADMVRELLDESEPERDETEFFDPNQVAPRELQWGGNRGGFRA